MVALKRINTKGFKQHRLTVNRWECPFSQLVQGVLVVVQNVEQIMFKTCKLLTLCRLWLRASNQHLGSYMDLIILSRSTLAKWVSLEGMRIFFILAYLDPDIPTFFFQLSFVYCMSKKY
ncbi:hypothetical protein MKX03_029837 [Papaver bracteatum]|nr:hypothetical protein MKX03_029837 [Papaver bracteatum]